MSGCGTMHDPTLAEAQKRAWLDGTDVPVPPVLDDWEWSDDFDDWSDLGEFCERCGRSVWACHGDAACDVLADDPVCDCGEPAWACICWKRDDERRVGALRHLELGPSPCPACDGDGVYEARIRGRLVPIGLCARCRGVGRG